MVTDQNTLPVAASGGAGSAASSLIKSPMGGRGGEITDGVLAQQFVTFEIAGEEYAVDIMSVREIKAWTGTTRLPNAPEFMRGVMNLRGVIVPIFDLRARFGLGATDATPKHVVIIIALETRIVGILVDAVSDILDITLDEIQPVPKLDRMIDADFLSGLVSVDERMVAMLSVERLFDLEALELPDARALTDASSNET